MTNGSVLVLYNEPLDADSSSGVPGSESDAGVLDEVAAIGEALAGIGVPWRRASVRTLRGVGWELSASSETCVINLVESLQGDLRDACLVPAVCSALGKAWTGSGSACQLLALDKWQAKCALKAAGVPVPAAKVVPQGSTLIPSFASSASVIVKPLCADASEGIDHTSVFRTPDPAGVRERVRWVHRHFGQSALVEHYVDGREFNVSILESDRKLVVLPLAEIDFSAFAVGQPRIVGYRAKWIADSFEYTHTPRIIPADIDEQTAERIRSAALDAWRCLGCGDYARVDIRLDANGEPLVIEVNPNPDISPGTGFAAALQAEEVPFDEFVRILLRNVEMRELTLDDPPRASRGKLRDIHVRRSTANDRDAIRGLVAAVGVFRPCEINVARDVLDHALDPGSREGYQSLTATLNETVVGWACFGAAPCASGTFELHWLVVSPACRRRRAATMLLTHAEAFAAMHGARLVVVETSSRADYAAAHRFYERSGYHRAGRVADFYEPKDDQLIYIKQLPMPQ